MGGLCLGTSFMLPSLAQPARIKSIEAVPLNGPCQYVEYAYYAPSNYWQPVYTAAFCQFLVRLTFDCGSYVVETGTPTQKFYALSTNAVVGTNIIFLSPYPD